MATGRIQPLISTIFIYTLDSLSYVHIKVLEGF
jgi:hypothetical protein